MTMTAGDEDYGFPAGYFVVRSAGSDRSLDVAGDSVKDGSEIILYPEKEKSLVEAFRDPGANNQARSMASHWDDRLVLRHRHPTTYPYPNKTSHPFPKFRYSKETGEITVHFEYDPAFPKPGEIKSDAWKSKTYVLTSVPLRKPRTALEDASQFITTNIFGPLISGFGVAPQHPPQATPEEVFNGKIELNDDEVVEEDRREEDEVDDSPELHRKLKVIGIANKERSDKTLSDKARERRKWVVTGLRKSNARTTGV
ncbi:hypothetical protein EST38_g8810 [Candolleomyces aberdarensis]|uniref:Uncharacterized protein n=1 Tax=Candolleomyces aberdarensis TaxID=2316362 RepID=A0A4Q2DDT8_9AGAR|nr:hypothetical protein EST38_g8810 [Candolleomyces aberdarensis]